MVREYRLDDRTTARVGYPDGHVEVDVDLPFPLSMAQAKATRSLDAETVLRSFPMLQHALDQAKRALGVVPARRAR